MAIVEYQCIEPSLFYYGAFKLLEYPDDISSTLNYLFAELFTDPWGDWDLIRRVFESFGTSSTVSNASFSKNEDIGDGVKTPWRLNSTSIGTLVQCYNIANDLGILVDSTASQITFVAVPNAQERIARKKWQACATQFQILKDIQTTQILVGFGCSPLYNSDNNLLRSPQQLQMYQSYLVRTTITASEQYGADISESALYRVSTSTLGALFGAQLGILRGDWWSKLLTLTPPTSVDYEIKRTVYTITDDDVAANEFTFPDDPTIAHIEYLLPLPEDATADVPITQKECFGVEYGDSQTWDCTGCDYVELCDNAQFLNPYYMDKDSPTTYDMTLDPQPKNTRIRIQYKKVTIT